MAAAVLRRGHSVALFDADRADNATFGRYYVVFAGLGRRFDRRRYGGNASACKNARCERRHVGILRRARAHRRGGSRKAVRRLRCGTVRSNGTGIPNVLVRVRFLGHSDIRRAYSPH